MFTDVLLATSSNSIAAKALVEEPDQIQEEDTSINTPVSSNNNPIENDNATAPIVRNPSLLSLQLQTKDNQDSTPASPNNTTAAVTYEAIQAAQYQKPTMPVTTLIIHDSDPVQDEESSNLLSPFSDYSTTESSPIINDDLITAGDYSSTSITIRSTRPRVIRRQTSVTSLIGSLLTNPLGTSTTFQAAINTTNVMLGMTLLSLPYALSLAGWIPGLILLSGLCLSAAHSAKIIAKCLDLYIPRDTIGNLLDL
jgi:hypothetical protein